MKTKTYLLTIALVTFVISTALAQHETHSGSGDDVITIEKPDGEDMPAILRIQGNSQGRHFSVTGYDSRGNRTDLLVNTTDSYNGIVPVDLPPRNNTSRLEISASGSWSVDVFSIGAATKINVPGSESGSGDNVLWVEGDPGIAQIEGNQGGRHFSVTSFGQSGERLKLLVNTTDPYSGKVIVPSNTLILKIECKGDWSIDLE